jgi:broad specificity phosphatase PhoE
MIYFVRHGESEANLKKVFAGQKDDSLLTDTGREQAKVTAQEIKAEGIVIDHIITSPLKRAYETATIIADILGINHSEIKVDARVQEYDMGTLSGTPHKRIPSVEFVTAEGAEDPEAFKNRVQECIHEALKMSGNVLIVSHAGVGRVLEGIREGIEAKYFYDLAPWGNASVTKIDWIK